MRDFEPGAFPTGIRPIREHEFQRFRTLIHREAGIHLVDGKQALVAGRFAPRLRELGIATYGDYYDLVAVDPKGEMVRMLDAICTNETSFFREPDHFDLLAHEIVAEWQADADAGRRQRVIRVWSAACSTGEEAYTLAMVLLGALPPSAGWAVQVVASDLSHKVLERARNGVWPISKALTIPDRYRRQFMLKGSGPHEGLMKVGPELRSVVSFRHLNLIQESYSDLGKFDAIFCRNVLIYFDVVGRANAVGRLLQHLKQTGYLFLGHSEGLTGAGHPLRSVATSVYTAIDRPDVRDDSRRRTA